jgi:hypothetical protein
MVKFEKLIEVTDEGRKQLQDMLNRTHKEKDNHTRDRSYHEDPISGKLVHNPVPTGFVLIGAWGNVNPELLEKYRFTKDEITRKRIPIEPVTPQSSKVPIEDAPIDGAQNEWLVFHGSDGEKCIGICTSGFSLAKDKIGSGTEQRGGKKNEKKFGDGIYFADSITKCDEYCGTRKQKVCLGLICRVMGGRAHATQEGFEEAIPSEVSSGQCDSVIGLQPATFNEFVVYDERQVYPEYLIMYQRLGPDWEENSRRR